MVFGRALAAPARLPWWRRGSSPYHRFLPRPIGPALRISMRLCLLVSRFRERATAAPHRPAPPTRCPPYLPRLGGNRWNLNLELCCGQPQPHRLLPQHPVHAGDNHRGIDAEVAASAGVGDVVVAELQHQPGAPARDLFSMPAPHTTWKFQIWSTSGTWSDVQAIPPARC